MLVEKMTCFFVVADVDSWWSAFKLFFSNKTMSAVAAEEEDFSVFSQRLSEFLFSKSGAKYKAEIRVEGNLTCGEPTPPIKVIPV